MAHKEQKEFFLKVRDKFPDKFKNCWVVDIGSLDINGNNKYLFQEHFEYVGVDVGKGKNVNVGSLGHEFKSTFKYDIVISSETFEHDQYWYKTILNCIDLTESGGLFTFTCASTGRPEHGTRKANLCDAPLLETDYYKNLTEDDVRNIINPDDLFSEYAFEVNNESHDLYFWGIKK